MIERIARLRGRRPLIEGLRTPVRPGPRSCAAMVSAPRDPLRQRAPGGPGMTADGRRPRGYGGMMPPAERRRVTPDGWTPALSPPWALVAGVAASCVVALVAALVWHTRWPNPADAEMMRWQEAVRARGDGIATPIVHAVGPLVLLAVLAGAALAWRVKRWDAVVLA